MPALNLLPCMYQQHIHPASRSKGADLLRLGATPALASDIQACAAWTKDLQKGSVLLQDTATGQTTARAGHAATVPDLQGERVQHRCPAVEGEHARAMSLLPTESAQKKSCRAGKGQVLC